MICYRIEEIKVVDQKNQNSNITQNNIFVKQYDNDSMLCCYLSTDVTDSICEKKIYLKGEIFLAFIASLHGQLAPLFVHLF